MTFTFESTRDRAKIKRIITHPRLYRHMQDDYAPRPEDFEPEIHPLVSYILARCDGVAIGLFIVSVHSRVLFEIHECFLPEFWGKLAHEATVQFRDWIWRNTGCMRMFGQTPAYNRLAVKFAKDAGMVQFGVHPRAFMKHGKLQDLVLLGIDRPDDRPEEFR